MPAAFVKSLAEDAGIDFVEAEKRWKKAKSIAEQQTGMTEGDGDDYWKYVAGVFKKSMGIGKDDAINESAKVPQTIKEWLNKFKKAKTPDQKEAVWYEFSDAGGDDSKLLQEMILSLPAGGYKLHSHEYGANITDKVYELYGKYPSFSLKESLFLGLSITNPNKVHATFTHDMDKIEIFESATAESAEDNTILESAQKVSLGKTMVDTEDGEKTISQVLRAITKAPTNAKKDAIFMKVVTLDDRKKVVAEAILNLPDGYYLYSTTGRSAPAILEMIQDRLGVMAYATTEKRILSGLAASYPKNISVHFTLGLEGVEIHNGKATKPINESATAEDIYAAAHEAATSHLNDLPEPTEAQKENGTYKMGHVRLYGLDISIENPKGSARRGVDPDGKPWETILPAHYGYIKRTEGADGDHVDVYIGEHPESERVFVVDQQDLFKGGFDEHKVVLACKNSGDARNVYCGGFSDGKGADRIGAITEISLDVFKEWLKTEKTLKPMSAVLESADYDWKAALESATSFSDIRIVFERSFPAVIKPIPKIGEDGYKLWFETKEEAIETMAAMQAEGIKADHVAEAYKDGRFMFKIYRSREEIDRINAEFKAASEKRAAEEKVRTEKARTEFEDVQGFDAGMAALQRGKVLAALNKQVSWNGVIESRKKQIEQQVSEGYYVEDHPKWGRLLKDPKDDSFWEEKTIGKTAMDYAIYLIGKNAA